MKRFITVFMVVVLAVAFHLPAYGASVGLSWVPPTTNEDGTPCTDLDGYNLYRGTASGAYTENIDVGNVTTFSWDVGDVEGETIYFNVTAYDTSGNESDYNGEINIPFPANPPNPPSTLTGTIQ